MEFAEASAIGELTHVGNRHQLALNPMTIGKCRFILAVLL